LTTERPEAVVSMIDTHLRSSDICPLDHSQILFD
jgi:hypothetical protein